MGWRYPHCHIDAPPSYEDDSGQPFGILLYVKGQEGIKSVSLYTNNPDKMSALQSITKEVVSLPSVPCEQNMGYLKTKKDRQGPG
eukprot:Skav230826  [mRNA]  locus=scaffold851:644087:652955:- [translate_table: standard]